MKATLTSKGQITIPSAVRSRLRLKAGDVLDFDENAPFLKATKIIDPAKWKGFGRQWNDPLPGKSSTQVVEILRGKVRLPRAKS